MAGALRATGEAVAEQARQLAILGVGNRLRGDDAIGCIVCDELCAESNKDSPPRHKDTKKPSAQSSIAPETRTVPGSRTGPCEGTVPVFPPGSCSPGYLGGFGECSLPNSVFVLDCGSTPENYVQPVADRKPTRILVVDCCNYGAKPGEFRLFSREEVDRLSYGLLSTHTLPLTLTIEMLSLETHATIELLGIQPQQIEFGEELSEPVKRALPAVAEFVRNWAGESQPSP